MQYAVVVILIVFSALFSGLTLGLMGLSAPELKRKKSLGDKDAAKVYKIRKKGNLLLTTLLIGNVAVNAALSIFLGSIASGLVAGLAATVLIVIFGEIIPQAVFSRFALSLGAKTAWLVRILLFVFYPVSWPIAWMLNRTLGEELATIYSKKELMKIVEEHEDSSESSINAEEEKIVKGALSFTDKKIEDIMTPRTVVKAVEFSERIDDKFLVDLETSGHSRFPVFKKHLDEIVGVLYIRKLLGKKCIGKTVGQIADKNITVIDKSRPLGKAFRDFLQRRRHLFVVRDEFNTVSGVVTLEDVLEEIIDTEIVDEVDLVDDLRAAARKKNLKKG